MDLIVISPETDRIDEPVIITSLFNEGMEIFHLRKPHWNKEKMSTFLHSIPSDYHTKIMLHSHHDLMNNFELRGVHFSGRIPFEKNFCEKQSISCHSFNEIEKQQGNFEYYFISPVFNSISKTGYEAAFTEEEIISGLGTSEKKIIALGGIDENTLETAKQYGFQGVGIIGAIWKQDDRSSVIGKFKRIQTLCQSNVHMF